MYKFIRIDRSSDEKGAWLESIGHIGEIVSELLGAFEHIVDSKLRTNEIKHDFFFDIRDRFLGLKHFVERSVRIRCIVYYKNGFENLLLVAISVVKPWFSIYMTLDISSFRLFNQSL